MKFGHPHALASAALALATSWAAAQTAAPTPQGPAKAAAKSVDMRAAQATAPAASGPMDRREKAMQTTSRVVKKTQDSASAVVGNTK